MLTAERLNLGPLECHAVYDDRRSLGWTSACVLCHGFGAPGTDLLPLAEEFCSEEPDLAEQVLFLFPSAPLQPPEFRPYGGRAWWPIDMLRLQRAAEVGDFRDLRQDLPERLPAARDELTAFLDAVSHRWGIPTSRTVLGGFSQGSMLATDVALHLPEAPAGLVIYSGTLLCEAEWTRLSPGRAGLRVLQSHGMQDPILPFTAAGWLRDLLIGAGLNVEFHSFHGGHAIPAIAVERTVALLKSLTAV